MERLELGEERLIVHTNFTKGNVQNDLVPPSHYEYRSTGVKSPVLAVPINLTKASHNSTWIAISQAQEEISELKKENQRLTKQQAESISRRNQVDYMGDFRASPIERSEQWTSELHLEAEKYKAESLKGQVQTLKEAASLLRDNIRHKDIILNRQAHELEATREELCETKAELGLVQEELCQSNAQKEKISSQLQKLTNSHSAELQEATRANSELKSHLQIMASEVLQLKGSLTEVSADRDTLKEDLSQTRQAFETQSATLHSLRNYIGQLSPESGEKERLNEEVERLKKENAVLQTTTELLTIRLSSVNEILALQEEKMIKKNSTDPVVKDGSECLNVLQLWREKVFKLCVQLRTKDIELRDEKRKLLLKVTSIGQQLEQEQHQTNVLQRSLDDKMAALDLERVEKETLKQYLAQAHKENSQLKLQAEKYQSDLTFVTEAVQRFHLVFKTKELEMDAAQSRLNNCIQRLTFAKRRVEMIQGLIMRRAALQKVQQSNKQAEQAADCIRDLQTELRLVSEERDKLTQELKRTPELIEKALSGLKEQYESKLMQKQKELEQSVLDMQEAVAGREQALQSLEQIQDQLQESEVKLEQLRCELITQQESSQRALEKSVYMIEERCAEKLKEMEDQVNTAKAEHTRAVMTLLHFERQSAKKPEHLQREHTQTKPGVFESGLVIEHMNACTTTGPSNAALWERGGTTSQRPTVGSKVQLPADAQLLSMLEELQSLSAAVVNSSEDSAEEEGQPDDDMRASTNGCHS